MTNTQKAVAIPLLALTVLGGGALLGYAQLSNAETPSIFGMGMMGMHMRGDRVHGEITAINGDTFTLKGMDGITYAVDVSDVTVKKFEAGEGVVDISVADLEVGDMAGVRGEVDGTSVDATAIVTGHPGKGMGMGMGGHRGGHGVMGEVTAVDGTTITVKGLDGKNYTINAGKATVSRVAEGSLSDINVGDRIGARGTVDGTTINASQIMDDIQESTQDEQ